jgi:hypothetical protein
MYTCSDNPKHLSVAIDKFDYILPYDYLVGGVLAIKTNHYKLINGLTTSTLNYQIILLSVLLFFKDIQIHIGDGVLKTMICPFVLNSRN